MGGIQLIVGITMLVPAAVSILYNEYYSMGAFLITGAITSLCGGVAFLHFRNVENNGQTQALVTASGAWLATSFFGALPFFLAAHLTPAEAAQAFVPAGKTYTSSIYNFKNFLHALFESVSSFTTTGLTMSVREPSMGYGLLFYRSFAQWLGGAGMIVLSIAILRQSGGMHSIALYRSESSGLKIRPNIKQTARAIWKVYLAVTAVSALYIFISTYLIFPEYNFLKNIFESINHAMTGQSTGGFSTFDDSISGYGSYAMEMIYLVPMVMGAVSIPLYYRMYEKNSLKELWIDYQGRWLILLVLIGSPLLVGMLLRPFDFSQAFREGVFQFVSALTTTGWQTTNLDTWPESATLYMALVPMVIGGSAGATVGGIKIFRAYLLGKGFVWRFKQVILPQKSVISLKIDQKRSSIRQISNELMEAYVFSMMYIIVLLVGIIISAHYAGEEFGLIDAIFESASAQGTVGLSAGLTSPDMPAVLEATYIIQMLIGRLELIPIVIMLRSIFNHISLKK